MLSGRIFLWLNTRIFLRLCANASGRFFFYDWRLRFSCTFVLMPSGSVFLWLKIEIFLGLWPDALGQGFLMTEDRDLPAPLSWCHQAGFSFEGTCLLTYVWLICICVRMDVLGVALSCMWGIIVQGLYTSLLQLKIFVCYRYVIGIHARKRMTSCQIKENKYIVWKVLQIGHWHKNLPFDMGPVKTRTGLLICAAWSEYTLFRQWIYNTWTMRTRK